MKKDVKDWLLEMVDAEGHDAHEVTVYKIDTLEGAKFGAHPPRTTFIEGLTADFPIRVGEPVTVTGESLEFEGGLRQWSTSPVTEVLDDALVLTDPSTMTTVKSFRFKTQNSLYEMHVTLNNGDLS